MGAVSVILVAFSIQELAGGDKHDKELHIPAAVVVGISFREFPFFDPSMPFGEELTLFLLASCQTCSIHLLFLAT